MPLEIHTQAICLSSFNYRDHDRIATYFTSEKGLIKLLVHSANRPRSSRQVLSEPLCLIHLTYRQKNGDIHSLKEAKAIDSFLELRSDYDFLCAALQLLNWTQKCHTLEEPNPKMFLLLKSYLKKIPQFNNPKALVCSYQLKLLILEGLWTIHTRCARCSSSLEQFYYTSNSYYCKLCAPSLALKFELEEIQKISSLIHERSYQKLNELTLEEGLSQKIEQLFLASHH